MEIVKKIIRRSLPLIIAAAVLSALIESKRLPAGVLLGGLLGLADIKGLAWGVSGLAGGRRITGRVVVFGMLRLLFIFALLAALLHFGLINIFGVLVGFTIVFAMVMVEGLAYSKSGNQ